MKILNLVFAIVYTVVYSLMFLAGFFDGDGELMFGCVLLVGPVVINWISYKKFKEIEKESKEAVKK